MKNTLPPNAASQPTPDDRKTLERLKAAHEKIRAELAKVIIGQDAVVDHLLLAIFSRGHCILEGVPGLAKTLLVSTLARCLELSFNRIQFTPDLMPMDITGTEVLIENKTTGERVFKFLPGPVFANLILADEINRTPPKTQAALLEAMQERQVSVGGQHYPMKNPFFVLATQNPIEQEGTYPLPEAQQDRFMFKILVRYPEFAEEYRIAESTTSADPVSVAPVIGAEEIAAFQSLVRRVPVPPHAIVYAMRLVRATRVPSADVPDFVRQWVSWGAGPRAVQFLLLGAKTRAALAGRMFVTIEDIQAVAHPVLRHRVLTNFAAESEGVHSDQIVDRLLEAVSADEASNALPEDVRQAFRA
jgi:MoxR-like ATPase